MSIWAKYICSILGIRIRKIALQKIRSGSFIVANHSGYLDTLVLCSLIPGVFVAKQELASWPLPGWLKC
jgi:1-acyl-sn-glycerol-3-phosphate acyltransferase